MFARFWSIASNLFLWNKKKPDRQPVHWKKAAAPEGRSIVKMFYPYKRSLTKRKTKKTSANAQIPKKT